MEKYSQELSLRSDGSAYYKEVSETGLESFERTGHGKWSVKDETVWVMLDELKKEAKVPKKSFAPMIPGIKDEVKIDKNILVDIPVDKLRTAPASGPAAPKNKWRRK
jgi:hypothetical protein